MTPLKEFQRTHGGAWSGIVTGECFAVALSIAREEKLKAIMLLTNEDIAANAAIHLGGLRDFLLYENGLLGLHEKKEFVFGDTGPETYPDPVVEAQEEATFAAEQEAASRGEREGSILARNQEKAKQAPKRRKKR